MLHRPASIRSVLLTLALLWPLAAGGFRTSASEAAVGTSELAAGSQVAGFQLRERVEPEVAERLARLALNCVDREYPSKIAHVLESDADALPPRALTPTFFGCYDWHSAVHGHWLLARLARLFPDQEFAVEARAALDQGLRPERIAVEVAYVERAGRESFERPYGLAWLLQLAAELREWDDDDARRWSEILEPLERTVVGRILDWVPKLTYPIRGGEHDQTAFAFGLMLDRARGAGDAALTELLEQRVEALYLRDRMCPLGYEPSGQDFLSPCLGEADLVRRVLSPERFAAWLGAFLPDIPLDAGAAWLEPAVVVDPTDGKLAHLDGLNLSRAWMLEGIASGLPALDPRVPPLRQAAAVHLASGLAAVTGEHYAGGHWLASFATYALTGRGVGSGGRAQARAAIDALLDGWHRAASVADAERYFDAFAPEGVFLGTEAGERWDLPAFRRYADGYFSQGRGWTYVPHDRQVEFSPDGSGAWFDERLQSDSYGELRGTGVARRIAGTWKIAQYNMTFTIPNGVAAEVVELIRGDGR